MMRLLQNLNVGKRLGGAFALLIVLTGALAAAGLVTMHQARGHLDEIVQVNLSKIRLSSTMQEANAGLMLALDNLSMVSEAAANGDAERELQAQARAYDAARTELYAMAASESGKALRARIDAARVRAEALNAQVLQLAEDNLNQEAQALLIGQARPAMQAWQQLIRENVALQNAQAQEAYAQAGASLARGRALLIAGAVAVVLLSALLGWLITRSLTVPLARATRVAEAISQGRLGNDVRTDARDEAGQLLRAMEVMQQELQRVLQAQREIGAQHDAGMISYRIPASEFPGEFGTMVDGINTLVAAHIAVKMRAVQMMQRYASGDLSQEMDELPGEKRVITDAINGVRASLMNINGEIKRLAQAAAAGDFSQRGDESHFEYDFALMITDLNAMMQVSDENLGKLSSLLGAIADGDLTARMEGDFRGVFATMRDDANTTVERLTAIVGQIQTASASINLAAGEIAAGNSDLSRRTEQQAANLEETAASMEELTSTVKQNAEHARQANQLAQGAATVASQGGDVVGQVVTTMSAIETSSKKIAEIISVIDGIAFQTNILALNAAVEAARAGEQGRGFAVVASEVRTLAQRSANAAKEIKGLIDDSVGKVADGSALVRQAGATMGEIVGSVQRVTDIMAEISAASQEQSAGIEQVNQTVVQMDETTQQNAALVEEATAAARALEDQAGELGHSVARFKLHADHAAVTAAPVVSSAVSSALRAASTAAPARGASKPAPRLQPRRAERQHAEPALAIAGDNWTEF